MAKEGACGLQLYLAIGDLELKCLELVEALAERLPLRHVGDRLIQRALRGT